MSKLVIPGSSAPPNLHLAPGVRAAMVEGDLYDICTRIREIDPSLYIIQLEDDERCAFAVIEHCKDGKDRLVSKHKQLDQRILNDMMRLKSIPFEHRFNELEKQIDKEEEAEKELQADEMYEKVGGPMFHELEKTGFLDSRGGKAFAFPSKLATT